MKFKIDIKKPEFLANGGLKLSRTAKKGIVIACLVVGLGSLYGLHLDNFQNSNTENESRPLFPMDVPSTVSIVDDFLLDDEVIVPYVQEDPINVSLEEINSLNIIINDNNCMDDFINEVCEELERDGINFTFTSNCENIDVDNAVVITLDQQYMAGPGTVIFAPYENNRLGNSDALSLAAHRAFYEKGFLVDGVACGQMGFRENEDGTVSERIPTVTEDAIGSDKDTSFVTISFGTSNVHAGLTAASIEAMLTRYYSYITGGYRQEDLIYCVEVGEDYDDIASKIGTTSNMLDLYNDTIDESMLLPGEAITNPIVGDIREFNQHVPTNLYIDKTLWSK